ncbi:MAG: thiol reductase thioredoxin [Flavobacteriaceae bacterium]|nr:thiol reductase thioredoxin [Flavobacteriaceae bacterium]|tara:strand:+ start:3115 stop:3411 length:297 start_codon:yes stop_codon:yes gene_type:complete
MSKFGDLIDVDVPVLFDFFSEQDDSSATMHEVLSDVASALGNKAKVIKIDVNKNKDLSQALRIKSLPTLIIYKFGDMKWRQSGESDATTIISLLEEYM